MPLLRPEVDANKNGVRYRFGRLGNVFDPWLLKNGAVFQLVDRDSATGVHVRVCRPLGSLVCDASMAAKLVFAGAVG